MNTYTNTFVESLNYMATRLALFMPNFIAGIIVLLLGMLIGWLVGQAVRRILIYTGLNSLSSRLGLSPILDKYQTTFADTVGVLVRWFFYLVTFVAVANVWQIPQLTLFLAGVAFYIPNVIVGVVILAIGFLAARFVYRVVETTVVRTRLTPAVVRFLANVAYYAIFVFSVMAALYQLGVAAHLIEILFAGLVTMIALAGGLAFGLGGRDRASRLIDESRAWGDRARRGV